MPASVSDCVNSQGKPLTQCKNLSENVTQCKTSPKISHRVKASPRLSHSVKTCLASAGTCGLPCRQIFANIYLPEFPLKVKPLPKGLKDKHLLVTSRINTSVLDIFDFVNLNHYLLTPKWGQAIKECIRWKFICLLPSYWTLYYISSLWLLSISLLWLLSISLLWLLSISLLWK